MSSRKAWKLLVSSCQQKLVERRQPQPAPVPVLPTFSCDECEAVYNKLRALRSHQMRAHQRRREARRYVLDSICCIWRWERSGAFWHGKTGALEPFSDDAVAAADQQDCAHRRQCKREGRSHLAGPPMLRGGAEGQRACLWWGTNAYGPRCFVSTVGSWVLFFARTRRRDARWVFFSRRFPQGFFCMLTSLPGETRW